MKTKTTGRWAGRERRDDRLRAVAKKIRELKAAPADCDNHRRWKDSAFLDNIADRRETDISVRPVEVDSFAMGSWIAHRTGAEPGDDGEDGCNTMGCIAGTTISVFRSEAQRIVNETRERVIWAVAAEILALDRETAMMLFRGTDDGRMNLATITAEQAATACENAAEGRDGADLWSHVPMGEPRPTPACATWR